MSDAGAEVFDEHLRAQRCWQLVGRPAPPRSLTRGPTRQVDGSERAQMAGTRHGGCASAWGAAYGVRIGTRGGIERWFVGHGGLPPGQAVALVDEVGRGRT